MPEAQRRGVPFLDPPAAIVHGRAAVGVAWLLQRAVNRGDLAGLPGGVHGDTVAAIQAVDLAARAWGRRTAAVTGRTAEPSAPDPSVSTHDTVTAAEAARVLRLSQRRVRDLAAAGLGRKAAGGWLLDRGAVEAEAKRRGCA